MGRVMFLLDEVEQLADACLRAQHGNTGDREAPHPALRVMHDEFQRIYLTGTSASAGERHRLRPVTCSLAGWQETPVLTGQLTGRRHRRLRPGRLGDMPLRGPESDLLRLIQSGVDAGWSTFVVDYVDGAVIPGVGRGRFRAPH
ncbi:hypothetical protein O7606_20395 [Micromonospora sp. WMMD882]|uniref:hypothetical protein n=1 Tax=Micromonospora sp. WMMD882 TaxID=3015151 RepID=UPI00248CE205|nr:hypothetical protein [Micromonospora sp. WMMD882]WBB78563.1 hypothetical protein O7606_20395 [Micromonospora sp. WMMD882]